MRAIVTDSYEEGQMDWNEERTTALKTLWLEGLSASQVARKLGGGVSRNAVIGKVHRMGLAGRDVPTSPRALGGLSPRRPSKPRNTASALPKASARAPRPAPIAPAPLDLPPLATILTLAEDTCRWPIGDPQDESFGFCGRTCDPDKTYCAGHARRAFRQLPKARKEGDESLARWAEWPATFARAAGR